MLLLGIETSCDDTATAVVRDARAVLANVSTNQDAFHAKFGGIVPEIASRQHLALLSAAVQDALERAEITLADLDGIAVTAGPGLIGSLVIGVASAKALASMRSEREKRQRRTALYPSFDIFQARSVVNRHRRTIEESHLEAHPLVVRSHIIA